MTTPTKVQQKPVAKSSDAKVLLSTLRMTTAIGAIGLTIAGWGLLARADAYAATQDAEAATMGFTGSAANMLVGAAAAPTETTSSLSAKSGTPQSEMSVKNALALRTTSGAALTGRAGGGDDENGDDDSENVGDEEEDHASKRAGALALGQKATSVFLPTPTSTPVSPAAPAQAEAPTAKAHPEPTATPVSKFTLNVVQWVSTKNGDPVAVVQDNAGTLWYVWGPDVTRIEQGLKPDYQPQPVNAVARSRAS